MAKSTGKHMVAHSRIAGVCPCSVGECRRSTSIFSGSIISPSGGRYRGQHHRVIRTSLSGSSLRRAIALTHESRTHPSLWSAGRD
jgi:hypothetical protein